MMEPEPGESIPSNQEGAKASDMALSADILPVAGCPGCVRALLSGYLDLHTVPVFRAAMDELLATPASRIILDCQGLSFVSAAGIGALVALHSEARERGGELILAGLSEKAFRMFQLLGFSDYFIRANSSLAAIDYARTTTTRGFPRALPCPGCAKTLSAPGPGEYRCQECGALVIVQPDIPTPRNAERPGTQ